MSERRQGIKHLILRYRTENKSIFLIPPVHGKEMSDSETNSEEEVNNRGATGTSQKTASQKNGEVKQEVKEEMAQTSQQVIIRKNLTKLTGNPGSISVDDWLRAVESYCTANKIENDADKINEAKDHICFDNGPARKVVRREVYSSWEDFKANLRLWLQIKPPEPHMDLHFFYSERWKSDERFIDYIDRLRDLLERLKTSKMNSEEEMRSYYRYMEATIVAQLPESVRREFMGKKLEVKEEKGFEKFINEIQSKLARLQSKPPSKPVLFIENKNQFSKNGRANPPGLQDRNRSISTNRSNRPQHDRAHREIPAHYNMPRNNFQRSQSQQPYRGSFRESNARSFRESQNDCFNDPKATRWEQKHHRCGRCLEVTHIRVGCNSKNVRCSLCNSKNHEYLHHDRASERRRF